MSESKPVLHKPPGYRDPHLPIQKPPPRKPNLPPSFHPRKNRRSSCRSCCCCLCLMFFIIIIIAAAAAAIFYLWFDPKLPVLHLKSIQFPKFIVTTSPDGPDLNAQTVIHIEIRNANNMLKLIYDEIHVFINGENGDLDLGSTTLPGFTQEKKNVTVLKFKTQVNNVAVDDGLETEFKRKMLTVATEVKTAVGIGWNGWRSGKIGVKVNCESISLKQVRGGAMPKCRINLLEWIYIN